MAEELRFMVCMRVDELEGEPMPGSTTTACVECGSDIWLAPDSRKFAAEKKAMPLCSRCAVTMAEDTDLSTTAQEFGMPIVPGQTEPAELKELISKLKSKVGEYKSIKDLPDWLKAVDPDIDGFDSLKLSAKAGEAEMTDPDDDWGSLVEIESWEPGQELPTFPLGNMLRSGVPKKFIAHSVLPAMIVASAAKRVLVGLSSWTLVGEPGEGLPVIDGPISEHPDRTEMLVLIDITAEGVQNMAFAEITRDGVHGPKLGEWKDSEKPEQGDGLFVEAIVPTLKLVKELRELSH